MRPVPELGRRNRFPMRGETEQSKEKGGRHEPNHLFHRPVCCFHRFLHPDGVNAGEVADSRSAEKFYQTCIGDEMAECLAQTPFQLSRSENLRAYAKTKASKAIFLADHIEELIQEMTDAGIPLRRHSVEAYLNRRFAEENGHLETELARQDLEE